MKEITVDDWHYAIWDEFNHRIHGKTISVENLEDNGRLHHQDLFFEIDNGKTIDFIPDKKEDTYYYKAVKNNEYYIIPKRFVNNDCFPFEIKHYQEVHLKKSDTQVWKFVLDIEKKTIPKKMFKPFKETILTFNPQKQSVPRTFAFLKMLAFSKGVKIGICSEVGGGKNTNLILMNKIKGKIIVDSKTPTKAIFYRQLYFNDHINCDEITSWKNSDVQLIEEMLAGVADENPDMTKFSMDKHSKMERMTGIGDKNVTFSFNPPSKDNLATFREKFANYTKIEDRYPILYLEGQITSVINKPSKKQIKEVVDTLFPELCKITSNTFYWLENLHKHIHGWDRDECKLVRRHLGNISRLLDVIDVFCDSQVEYDDWLVWINERVAAFKNLEQNEAFKSGKLI